MASGSLDQVVESALRLVDAEPSGPSLRDDAWDWAEHSREHSYFFQSEHATRGPDEQPERGSRRLAPPERDSGAQRANRATPLRQRLSKSIMTRLHPPLLTCFAACAVLFSPHLARAAALEEVDQGVWWQGVEGLPSYVNMYIYVPDQTVALPPIVVAPHHCQGDGKGTFSEMSGLVSMADTNGFIMVFPEATGQNCWDAGSDRSLQHDGKGDTHAIVQMVRYTLSTYDGNPARVYSVGGSSGGIMTEALLGVYPDVFMAGVSLMGVPCGCWAEGYNDVVGTPSDGTGQWSGPCSGGSVDKTAEQWGDLVRSFFPEYSGHRPRLQHWHGTADTVLSYDNVAEDVEQWTNLLDLSTAPTGTDSPKDGTTREYWTNACGYVVYETFSLSGVGHSVPFDASAVATYFGLDDAEGLDPETEACPDAVPGGVTLVDPEGSSGSGGNTGQGMGMNAGGTSTSGAGGQGAAAAAGGTAPIGGGGSGSPDPITSGGSPSTIGGVPSSGPGAMGTGNPPAMPGASAGPTTTDGNGGTVTGVPTSPSASQITPTAGTPTDSSSTPTPSDSNASNSPPTVEAATSSGGCAFGVTGHRSPPRRPFIALALLGTAFAFRRRERHED